MGVRKSLRTDLDDFKRGFTEAVSDDTRDVRVVRSAGDRVLQMFAFGTRVVLFGFLLALPGVPFLPWGKPAAMAATLAAAVLASVYVRAERTQNMRAAAVLVIFASTLRVGSPPTTSMILVGAVATTVAALASSYPAVYVGTAGAAVAAVVVGVFDLHPFDPRQLPLSGRPFEPDRFTVESLRFLGFMFLSGILHFGRSEMDRLRGKAEEAEAARDAAINDERARIARELHDVVSHHVTAMTLQAEAAAMTGDKTALSSVAEAGRAALTELRRMLGVLRRPDDDTEPDGVRAPQPGLGNLDQLVARASTGLRVSVERKGDVRALPAGVELCAFRLVQESLTNTAKHSDAATVDVVLTYGATDLAVDVIDDGRPLGAARVASNGFGVLGMRERVALLDGELTVGPRREAPGYAVHARLPVA